MNHPKPGRFVNVILGWKAGKTLNGVVVTGLDGDAVILPAGEYLMVVSHDKSNGSGIILDHFTSRIFHEGNGPPAFSLFFQAPKSADGKFLPFNRVFRHFGTFKVCRHWCDFKMVTETDVRLAPPSWVSSWSEDELRLLLVTDRPCQSCDLGSSWADHRKRTSKERHHVISRSCSPILESDCRNDETDPCDLVSAPELACLGVVPAFPPSRWASPWCVGSATPLFWLCKTYPLVIHHSCGQFLICRWFSCERLVFHSSAQITARRTEATR